MNRFGPSFINILTFSISIFHDPEFDHDFKITVEDKGNYISKLYGKYNDNVYLLMLMLMSMSINCDFKLHVTNPNFTMNNHQSNNEIMFQISWIDINQWFIQDFLIEWHECL
jgi:hypothetical protein